MFANPDQPERRDHSRRLEDRSSDNLHKTFSTPYCHSCLERIADGVLLLDNDTRVIFSTPYVQQIMKKQGVPFSLSPKFRRDSNEGYTLTEASMTQAFGS
jgi:hypothetical protein